MKSVKNIKSTWGSNYPHSSVRSQKQTRIILKQYQLIYQQMELMIKKSIIFYLLYFNYLLSFVILLNLSQGMSQKQLEFGSVWLFGKLLLAIAANNSLSNSNSVFIFLFHKLFLIAMKSNLPNLEGQIVMKNYKIMQKIGAGAFGEIYKAQNQSINNQFLAIKTQSVKTKFPQLLFEARLLEHIHAQGIREGIPQVYGVTMENGHNIMVMDLLGKSLDYYFTQCNKKFSLKTVLKIGLQLLNRIQILHQRGFLHRDIKPDNMMMGLNQKSDIVYLIDLGLSKRFMIEQDYHIPMKKGNQLIGTLRYASISNHKGFEQSRRDDLQSIGYVLVYFLIGSLPWQSIKATSVKEKVQMIKNKKISTPAQKFCPSHSNLAKFIKYTHNLKFDEKPNYEYLRNVLRQAAEVNNIKLQGNFDWEESNQPQCEIQ